MPITQEQVMQLIGTWGYTPDSLETYIQEQRQRAVDMGEAVGFSMYASLLTLCKFAQTADSHKSLKSRIPGVDTEIGQLLDGALDEMIRDKGFADGVIGAVYDSVSACVSVKEAEAAMRREVVMTIAPMVVQSIGKLGADAADKALQAFVGADDFKIGNPIKSDSTVKKVSDAISRLIDLISSYSDKIKACKETPRSDINEMADGMFGDVDELIFSLQLDMLSILDLAPHAWTEYALRFGRFIAAFMFAVSIGEVTYDEYDEIGDALRKISKETDSIPKTKIVFGAN